MPGAVGQVQDVGLIFLSAMATAVVARGRDSGADFGDTLATSLLLMTLVTFTVGVLVILVGERSDPLSADSAPDEHIAVVRGASETFLDVPSQRASKWPPLSSTW